MTRLFGTDGVRGVANKDLTPHLALNLSIAAAQVPTVLPSQSSVSTPSVEGRCERTIT